MDKILVLGAGKSSFVLIEYLAKHSTSLGYSLLVADASEQNLEEKSKFISGFKSVKADLASKEVLSDLIENSTLVVSLLPPFMHVSVAKLCLQFGKNMLTASYVSDEMKLLGKEAEKKGLTFLMECGLDPGIDHMSAMKIINDLKDRGAEITSFYSYCGGLISPESDTNPWGYKITWNPRNVVTAGKGTAQFLEKGVVKYVPYHQLFKRTVDLEFDLPGHYEAYPNRDSLSYIPIYGLDNIKDFVRGTIRKKGFSEAWNCLVQLGLTDEQVKFEASPDMTIKEFVKKFLPGGVNLLNYLQYDNNSSVFRKLDWLGLYADEVVNVSGLVSPADYLQTLIEQKWHLEKDDKDMVLMQHIFKYKKEGKELKMKSTLIVKGENQLNTAMAKTVGLPLAITTLMLFRKKIDCKGVIIPIVKEIYNPVLDELHNNNLIFREYTYS